MTNEIKHGMQIFDVVIVGGGPAGSTCAACCALAGLHTLVLERERFPREKVCGDCLNPSCWPVLKRLGLAQQVRDLPHSKLTSVDFIAIDGRKVSVDLPTGDPPEAGEISVKRSIFDDLLLKRACELGAYVREQTTLTGLAHDQDWKLETATRESFRARVLIGADGRNSTVARLRNLLPRPARERVALQAHIPLPRISSRRLLRTGSSKRHRAQSLPRGEATHYFETAAMGTATLRNPRQSTLAHHHTAHTLGRSLCR